MSEELIDLDEIAKQFEERGFFRRLGDMFSGLKKPRGSREYKIARVELQRLAAPLIAIVAPVLGVLILIVVTAVQGQQREQFKVDIQEISKEDEPIKEEEEIPPDDIEPPPEDVEITVDTPTPGPVSNITPQPSPPSPQQSVKPAQQDTVAFVKSPVTMKSMTGSRTPGSIGAATRGGSGYGDPTTEAAVMKVLWWLKATQNSDGSWNGVKPAATGLALLTFLAHGEFPGSPSPYKRDFGPVVENGLNYLCGLVSVGGDGLAHMQGVDGNEYAFLIATYALCEAYGMTKNPNCREAAEVCLERIVKGQSPTGGWDYKINPQSTRDDMSFAGWALQALKAGKMAGMHPEGLEECIKKAVRCLQTRNFKNGGFNYTAGGNPTGLTATGCLAMQLLGYGNKPEVTSALDYMREWKPTFDKDKLAPKEQGVCPQYYCYYATQCKYQAGMKQGATKTDESTWFAWNAAMKKLYPSSIIDLEEKVLDWTGKGHKQGYYQNNDNHTTRPVMDTCLAALQLMVYYRYLPTTQTKAGAESAADDEGGGAAAAAAEAGKDVEVKVEI